MILIKPPLHLEGHVEGFWSLRGRPQGLFSGLPKPYVELIISLSGIHHWQASLTSPIIRYSLGWMTPVQSGPKFAQTFGPLHLLGVRLGVETATRLFGPAVNGQPAYPIPLEDLLGTKALRLKENLLEFDTEAQRLTFLAKWISDEINFEHQLQLPTSLKLRHMGWRTDTLAEYLGLSPRGLRKRFNTQVGIGPKFWLQLNRFDSIITHDINSISLAAAAAAYGYSDQAHMTTEFGRFAGRSPGKYLLHRARHNAPEDAPHFVPETI